MIGKLVHNSHVQVCTAELLHYCLKKHLILSGDCSLINVSMGDVYLPSYWYHHFCWMGELELLRLCLLLCHISNENWIRRFGSRQRYKFLNSNLFDFQAASQGDSMVWNIWFSSPLIPWERENLVLLSLYIFWGKCVYFSIFEW